MYALYATLSGDARLAEFAFVTTWPSLKPEEKRERYRKYACHELHFFLARRDPDFFRQAIRPYLANKKEKQFLDQWLLDADLAGYVRPWDFDQLNTFEQILLGRSIAGQRASVTTLVKDQFDVLPPDPARRSRLFETALKGSALDTGDAFGIQAAKSEIAFEAEALGGADWPYMPTSTATRRQPRQPPMDPTGNEPASVALGEAGPAKDAKMPALGRKKRTMERAKKQDESRKEAGFVDAALDMDAEGVEAFADERDKLGLVEQYYRQLDKTMEWVESNYYQLPLEQQTASLIEADAFWNDYAAHAAAAGFLPPNLADATHSFPEMMAALALVDLPFTAAEHKTKFDGIKMTLSAGGPMIVYHEQIEPAARVAETSPVLVSENFFRQGDRFRQVGGEQFDKFVTDEFLVDTVYGCQVVVTNPTSSKQKVDVLLQIPSGAMPVLAGHVTRSIHLDLEPYHTESREYFFYFPAAGEFLHYGVQVATGGEVLTFVPTTAMKAVAQLTNIDKQSWDYVSQHGSEQDVVDFLKSQNLERVNLDRLAWRMQEEKFFRRVIALLAAKHTYNHTLWSYSVKHNDVAAMRQYLQFADDFVRQCGPWLDSPLLSIDPVVRKTWQQMDYRPLVNARTGRWAGTARS